MVIAYKLFQNRYKIYILHAAAGCMENSTILYNRDLNENYIVIDKSSRYTSYYIILYYARIESHDMNSLQFIRPSNRLFALYVYV